MAFKTKNAGVSWCISMFESGGKDDNLTEVLDFFRDATYLNLSLSLINDLIILLILLKIKVEN